MKHKNPSEASVLFDRNNVLAHMCAGEMGDPFEDRKNEFRSSREEKRRILEFEVLYCLI